MNETVRYQRLRREMIDLVFFTAFTPSPTEPQPPTELYSQLRPTLELCSLWGLLKRLRILDPKHSLYDRVALWEIIHRAASDVRPENVIQFSADEEERFARMDEEADREFGPPTEYAPDSQVLHLKSVSLIMSLNPEDVQDPEGADRRRRLPSGVDVIEFVDALYRCHRGHSVFAIDWARVKNVAQEFDQLIKSDLASS